MHSSASLTVKRVPVISPDGRPLMPTKPSRARRWLGRGKARIYPNDLNIFAIQLLNKPSGQKTQDVVIGIDPGKLFSGIGLQSSKATLLKLHLILPFPNVTKKMTARRILRRARRGRRINRKLPYDQRCHKAKRFDNRVQKKLPPSIRANRQLELRVVKEATRLFPISHIVYEYIKARGNKGFSPAYVEPGDSREYVERFEREAQVLAQLNHPGIPRYLDYFYQNTPSHLCVSPKPDVIPNTYLNSPHNQNVINPYLGSRAKNLFLNRLNL